MIISFYSFQQWRHRLLLLLTLKAFFLFFFIIYGGIQLGPDEAQYWTWSQALDVGYYSKPPGIAWQIKLGTILFGDSELGVRFLSLAIGFLQSLFVFELGRSTGLTPRSSFWAALFMAVSPLGFLGSFFALTDGGLLLAWTGASIALCSPLDQKKEPKPSLIGMWIAIGALFKWPIFLFWPFFLCARFLFFPTQPMKAFLKGCLLSLLGLLPSLWWNFSNDWATFRHVAATLEGGSVHQAGGNFWDFFGAQFLLLSPIVFCLVLYSLYQGMKDYKGLTSPLKLCFLMTTTLLGGALLVSSFQKMQGNWMVCAYPTSLIFLVWVIFEKEREKYKIAKIALAFSVFFSLVFFSIPILFEKKMLPYRYYPLKHNSGWREMQKTVEERGYDPKKHFLVSDKYQTSSLLSFYTEGQKRAYFLNLKGVRNNQFSYWPSLYEKEKGKEGFFVWVENAPRLEQEWKKQQDFYQEKLKLSFEEVTFEGLFPLLGNEEKMDKGMLIFRCQSPLFEEVKKVPFY